MTWPPAGVDWYYADAYTAIACGDCREVLPLLPKVDCVITDPPYNCGKDYGTYKDNLLPEQYCAFMETVFAACLALSANLVTHIPKIWFKEYLAILPAGQIIVIERGAQGFPTQHGWSDQCDFLYAIGRPSKQDKTLWSGIRLKGEGYFFREDTFGHPGYTPIDIARRCLAAYGPGMILDPFAGTGTTLRAAKDRQQKSIGIELNERYAEIAAKRLAQGVLPLFNEPSDPPAEPPELFTLDGSVT